MKKYIIIATLALLGFGSYSFTNSDYFEISKNLEIFASLYKEVNTFYVDDVDPNEFIQIGIDAMLESLDPYTTYYPESEIETYKFQTTGKYGGIGSYIKKRDDYIIISEPYEDSPAAKAGLKAGDKITQVDGKSLKGKTSSEVSKLLKGEPGTTLNVSVLRPQLNAEDKALSLQIKRAEVQRKNVTYFGMINETIGYIKLEHFTQKAGEEVENALKTLKEENSNLQALVLDLRGNGGGLLNQAVRIVNAFVEKNQLVCFTKGKIEDWNKEFKTTKKAIDSKMPLAVLTNRYSASASEIVSGAVQDLDRGVVLGQKTFGKGLVQTTKPLDYNTTLKVTTAKYHIPSGRCIQSINYEGNHNDKIPDSLKVAFKTSNGRTVYDGGGIDPDVKVDIEQMSYISSHLVRDDLIFDYATRYSLMHQNISNAKDFKISEKDFQAFVEWLKTKDFEYGTNSEKLVEELEKTAKEDEYYKAIEATLAQLKQELHSDKAKDLDRYKEEVKMLLSSEIVKRYYYEKGAIENYFQYDKELKKAIEILSNSNEYEQLLSSK